MVARLSFVSKSEKDGPALQNWSRLLRAVEIASVELQEQTRKETDGRDSGTVQNYFFFLSLYVDHQVSSSGYDCRELSCKVIRRSLLYGCLAK